MKSNQFNQVKQTRFQIVNERPRLTDLSMPRNLFYYHYRALALPRMIIRLLLGLYILLRWNNYTMTEKEALKEDYFYYFWIRKYKKKK